MANIGVIPGDLIIPATVWPGPVIRQPIERGLGYRFYGTIDNATAYTAAYVSPDATKILFLHNSSNTQPRISPINGDNFLTAATTMPGQQVFGAWSPDSSEFAVTSTHTPFIRRWNSSDLSQIPDFNTADLPQGSGGAEVRYSPNGRFLAVGGGSTTSTFTAPGLWVYDLSNKSLVTLSGVVPTTQAMYALDFSPDGSKLLCVPRGSGVSGIVYDTATWTGVSVPQITVASSSKKSARFSPDGTKFAFTRSSSSATAGVSIVDAMTYAAYTFPAGVLPSSGQAESIEWIDNTLLLIAYSTQSMLHLIDCSTTTVQLVAKIIDFNAKQFGLVRGGARRYFAGTVKDAAGNPLSREVRVAHRMTGRLLATVRSNASDGKFSAMITTTQPCLVYAVGDGGEMIQYKDSTTPVATLP